MMLTTMQSGQGPSRLRRKQWACVVHKMLASCSFVHCRRSKHMTGHNRMHSQLRHIQTGKKVTPSWYMSLLQSWYSTYVYYYVTLFRSQIPNGQYDLRYEFSPVFCMNLL